MPSEWPRRAWRQLTATVTWMAAHRALGTLGALAVCVWGLARYADTLARIRGQIVIDDAFITYRYAENWANGLGATWNAGEPPIEGYSTPLYMAMLALGKALLGVSIPGLSEGLCIAFGIGTITCAGVLTWQLTRSVAWALTAAGALAAHTYVAVWSVGGMETSLYAFLLTLSTSLAYSALASSGRGPWIALTGVLACAALTRTEGAIATIAFAAYAIVGQTRSDRTERALRVVLAVLGVYVAHLLVRRWYYGAWVSIPVIRKAEPFGSADIVRGFFEDHGLLFALFIPAVWATRGSRVGTWLRLPAVLTLLLSVVVLNVDPVMSGFGRFLYPILPCMFVVGAVALCHTVRRIGDPLPVLAFLGVVLAARAPAFVFVARGPVVSHIREGTAGLERSHVALAHWLREQARSPSWQVALGDCGVVPYYARLRVIDLYGLNDSHLARSNLDVDYVFGRRPELIVLAPITRIDAILARDRRLARDYRLVRVFEGGYRMTVYRRRDVVLRSDPGASAHPSGSRFGTSATGRGSP